MSQEHAKERMIVLFVTVLILSSGSVGTFLFVNGAAPDSSTSIVPLDFKSPAGSYTISISFNPAGLYNVTFSETGLPTGTEWYVNLTNGQTYYSNSGTLSFTEYNGSYNYIVATGNKIYKPSTPSSFFTISGSAQSIPLAFTKVTYSIGFSESNLPPGVMWFVNLTNGQAFNSTSSFFTFNESNGTYNYNVASGNKIYSPSPPTGQFTVYGGPRAISITFIKVVYTVTFKESGLPLNTEWFVNVTGGQSSLSSVSTVQMNLTNGTYTINVSTVNKEYSPLTPSFSLRVNGHSFTDTVQFALNTYGVSFTQSGLPSGTKWYINVSDSAGFNHSYSSTSGALSFNLPNGTYNFTVTDANIYFGAHNVTGNFTVAGGQVSIQITFIRFYRVTFNEIGLPGNVKWYVNITDPESFSSMGTIVQFLEPNGSYHYDIGVANSSFEVNATSMTGNFSVSGNDVVAATNGSPIVFSALHKVTFTETGLPYDNLWYLNVSDGKSFSTYSNRISFLEPNGTYSYKLTSGNNLYKVKKPYPPQWTLSIKGWPLSASQFSISVTFEPLNYTISFNEVGLSIGISWYVTLNGSTFSGNPSTVTFNETNGTYAYSIRGISGFKTTNYGGNVTVNGSNVTVVVKWAEVLYTLQIVQNGITAGTQWAATLTGKEFDGTSINITLNSTGSVIDFNVPNGTYTYTLKAPFGYSGTHETGNIRIQGKSESAAAFLKAPNYLIIATVLALIMAGLMIVLYVLIKRDSRSVFKRENRFAKRSSELLLKKK